MSETYGQQVVRLRKARGWNQQDLADQLGMSLRAIQAIEAGETAKPQRATRDAIARVLEIEGSPEGAAQEWTQDIETFRDVIAAYLAALPERDRKAAMNRFFRIMFPAKEDADIPLEG